MKLECVRYFGEPPLKKPKECNNKTLLGSVRYAGHDKPCKCKLWLSGDTVYVLHRNWFSNTIGFDEAFKLGIIKKTPNSKFVYDDNFGGVILRNEAIFSFKLPDMSRFILDSRFALVKEFADMRGVEWYNLYGIHRWEDFFEEILKLIKEKVGKKTMEIKARGLIAGQRFKYGGFDWIALEVNPEPTDTVLALAQNIVNMLPFDNSGTEGTNDWERSSIREWLHTDFAKLLSDNGARLDDDFVSQIVDTVADDGTRISNQTVYDKILLLSNEKYRKYRYYIDSVDNAWWLITPWSFSPKARPAIRMIGGGTGFTYVDRVTFARGVRPVISLLTSATVEVDLPIIDDGAERLFP